MAYQRRSSALTNTIKLTFDFDTLDRLTAEAAARKVDRTRCAYELLQEALGVRSTPPAAPVPAPEPDDIERTVARGFDQIKNYKPKGEA